MSSGLVALLAVACGVTVANTYYVQPLLDTIARDLGVASGTAGLLVTFGQVGYVCGLILLVPLGDLLDRRALVPAILVLDAIGLAVASVAPSFGVLASALAVVGVSSVCAQILVPFASTLAADEERGSVVGRVMSGLLIGILGARTVSGIVADLGGWRLIYGLACAVMLTLALVLRRALPDVPSPSDLPYARLLRSVWTLVREEPILRRRMVYGGVSMASFNVVWTTLAFLLSGPPHHFSDAVIGLFALAGLAGAFMASVAGRLADRGHTRAGSVGTSLCILIGWGFLALGKDSVLAVIAGLIVLDLGVQGIHILNQSAIYRLRPEARSRLTTAYMSAYFTGAMCGSAGASLAWSAGGWGAVCGLGAGAAVVGLLALIGD